MDISDIVKSIVNVKNTWSEAEQLRIKLNEENEKSIQWQIEYQHSYNQLSEEYKQLETNYERLKQKLLQVQMDREKMSEAYVNQKQHRRALLNKVTSTGEICDTLTNYINYQEERFGRYRSNLSILKDSFNNATDIVKNIKEQYERTSEKIQSHIVTMEGRLKLLLQSQNQLEQFCERNKQNAAMRIENAGRQYAEEKQRTEELKDSLQNEVLQTKTIQEAIKNTQNLIDHTEIEIEESGKVMKKEIFDMEDKIQKQVQAYELMKKDINLNKDSIAILNKENINIQENLDANEKIIQLCINEIQQLNDLIKEHQKDLEIIHKDLSEFTEKCLEVNNEKEKELATAEEEIKELTTMMEDLKTRNALKLTEHEEIQKEYNEQNNLYRELESNLNACNDELVKLKEEIKVNEIKFNNLLTELNEIKGNALKLEEVSKTHEEEIDENVAKYEQLQKDYEGLIKQKENILKEKDSLIEVNANIVMDCKKKKEERQNRIDDIEKAIKEKKMELEDINTSIKTIPVNDPQDDNANLPTSQHIKPTPNKNDIFFAMPVPKDIFSNNFSDSSQGSRHKQYTNKNDRFFAMPMAKDVYSSTYNDNSRQRNDFSGLFGSINQDSL